MTASPLIFVIPPRYFVEASSADWYATDQTLWFRGLPRRTDESDPAVYPLSKEEVCALFASHSKWKLTRNRHKGISWERQK